jgi:hypothetical protein
LPKWALLYEYDAESGRESGKNQNLCRVFKSTLPRKKELDRQDSGRSRKARSEMDAGFALSIQTRKKTSAGNARHQIHGNVDGETASISSPGCDAPSSNGSQDMTLKDVKRIPVLSEILARKVEFYYLDIHVV